MGQRLRWTLPHSVCLRHCVEQTAAVAASRSLRGTRVHNPSWAWSAFRACLSPRLGCADPYSAAPSHLHVLHLHVLHLHGGVPGLCVFGGGDWMYRRIVLVAIARRWRRSKTMRGRRLIIQERRQAWIINRR